MPCIPSCFAQSLTCDRRKGSDAAHASKSLVISLHLSHIQSLILLNSLHELSS